jgi:hypothetical protein
MKKVIIVLFVLCAACASQKLDESVAKAKVVQLLELLKQKDYAKAQDLYTHGIQEGEPKEARIKKMQDIEKTAGDIVSYEFVESTTKKTDDGDIFVLKYKVKCAKTTLNESFGVVIEDGECKITSHDINNTL